MATQSIPHGTPRSQDIKLDDMDIGKGAERMRVFQLVKILVGSEE